MEIHNSSYQLLELISKPAFCVKDSLIVYANQAARSMQLEHGAPIDAMLGDNREAYTEFHGGCLYTSLRIAGIDCSTTVRKIDGLDVFTLEDPTNSDQLRVLSLAGQQLRVPLASLVAAIDMLFIKKGSTGIQQYSNQIQRGIHQLHRMINNMSDTAYLGAKTPTEEVLDLDTILREIIEKSTGFLGKAHARIQYRGLDHPVYTRANRNLLERAALNMLSNAVKFSAPDTPITVTLSQKGSKLQLSMSNQCKDLRPDALTNAFSGYQRKPTIEDSRAGIGLGMPLIRAAAQAHGGTVLIDQPEESLVRVTVTLAIRQPADPTLLRSPLSHIVDYAAGRDRALLELSEVLPTDAYRYESP